MADQTQHTHSHTQDPLVDVGGKQVPLSSVNKPHFAVIGGTEKAIPNLDDFPPLEPLAVKKEEPKPQK